uniref:Uncharacterized protein n=1 Tax=Anguilla anguilla TaxID=7936 RepID=A0A0E9VRC3_ANGAN
MIYYGIQLNKFNHRN